MTTESKTPRTDAMFYSLYNRGDLDEDFVVLARDLERENARLREALEAARNSLSAVCWLLETYPRPSNDPNGRTLLDAREHSCAASRAARAALVQS